MATTATRVIPPWLEEHCMRLCEPNSDVLNLNLNIRRLDHPSMMISLARALNSKNARIETINFTSSFATTAGRRRGEQERGLDVLEPLTRTVLPNHPSLRILHLSYNKLQYVYGIEHVLRTNKCLLELHLDHNILDTNCAIQLASGLRYNSTLQVLQLNSNRIGDEGGTALARALNPVYNRNSSSSFTCINYSSLRQLGLSNNNLGTSTARALYDTMQQNLILKQINLDDNPHMSQSVCLQIQFYVRSNQVGRHLLRQSQSHQLQTNNSITDSHSQYSSLGMTSTLTKRPSVTTISIWPYVMEGLEPDMIYFFLHELPELCMRCSVTDSPTFDDRRTSTSASSSLGQFEFVQFSPESSCKMDISE